VTVELWKARRIRRGKGERTVGVRKEQGQDKKRPEETRQERDKKKTRRENTKIPHTQ